MTRLITTSTAFEVNIPLTRRQISLSSCLLHCPALLLQVGVGRFHWLALAICGLANAADAVEILGLSLVLPAAEDDLHLAAQGKSALSSSIFVGMLLGGVLWGPLGDSLGRRTTLALALAINATFGMLSAAARTASDLVFLRLIAGIGVGGSVPVVFSFLAELLPAHARGKFMVGLAAHWMVGSIYSAGVGWAMIPTIGWRSFLIIAAIPAWIAAAGTLLLLPESPRYLLVHGQVQQAEQAIRRMAQVNGVKLPPNMHLRHHESLLLAHDDAASTANGEHSRPSRHSKDLELAPLRGANGGSSGKDPPVLNEMSTDILSKSATVRSSNGQQQHRTWVEKARRGLTATGKWPLPSS
eukprot:GHUV01030197.1.p1 GENE.GHUV01030197.1~~GHUV01030197.1.p1  ORF type:complete len:355 (+),score=73.51 GHUV01030197.1:160-1224(+)